MPLWITLITFFEFPNADVSRYQRSRNALLDLPVDVPLRTGKGMFADTYEYGHIWKYERMGMLIWALIRQGTEEKKNPTKKLDMGQIAS